MIYILIYKFLFFFKILDKLLFCFFIKRMDLIYKLIIFVNYNIYNKIHLILKFILIVFINLMIKIKILI
jgi:hypothetical protein